MTRQWTAAVVACGLILSSASAFARGPRQFSPPRTGNAPRQMSAKGGALGARAGSSGSANPLAAGKMKSQLPGAAGKAPQAKALKPKAANDSKFAEQTKQKAA